MPSLRALLLTDVVDSTKLTEELGDAAMAELWAAHDRIARDLLPLWRGREIDKTDGMLLLFDAAADAVGYALAYHRALAARALPFKARAGIHVGPVSLRPNPPDDVARGAKPVEVDGLALPIAARVMSVALGAQTLLSADARLALGVPTQRVGPDDRPQRVMSHGHWRMHGVADPVELFEVGEAGAAPFTAPPDGAKVYRVMRQGDLWQPVREVRHSVPAERDSFVGRQEPLQLLAQKFEHGARLVSVLGMGGTGKTRLVTRFAWTWLGDYPGGVWFCDLSQARSVDGVHFAVAQGLDVPLGKTEPVVQLAYAIAGRGKCLVILDNFEQVARFAEETLGRWLDRAPLARFLVTTREVLGIVGEEMLALAPLALPDAATLFLRRAESTRIGYAPGTDDLAAIDQLVKVLDGLPLAIELAAARVRVLPPRALLERMTRRFDMLMSNSGRRDRQATLRAAFDWSWELLSEGERSALAQLSVFEGGFTVASAGAVIDLARYAAPIAAHDAVQWLVDKSFVRPLEHERFDLLESVREYAAEHLRTRGRLAESGPDAQHAARRRHWQYFAGVGEREPAANHCADASNLVAACRWAIAADDAASAAGCLNAVWLAVRLTGPFRTAVDLATSIASAPGLSDAQRALVHWVAANAARMQSDTVTARDHIDRGLSSSRHLGRSVIHGRLLLERGSLQSDAGLVGASLASLEEAAAIARSVPDTALGSSVELSLGLLLERQGRLGEARRHYQTALELARSIGDRRLEGGILGNLGGLQHALGQHALAQRHYDQALALSSQVGNRRWEGSARSNLGLLNQEMGDVDSALDQYGRSLAIAREIGDIRLEYTVLCNWGIALSTQARHTDARPLFEQAIASATAASDNRSEGQFRGYLAVCLAHQQLVDEALESATRAKLLLSAISDPMSLALATCQSAEVAFIGGQTSVGNSELLDARRLARNLDVEPNSELGRLIARLAVQYLHPA